MSVIILFLANGICIGQVCGVDQDENCVVGDLDQQQSISDCFLEVHRNHSVAQIICCSKTEVTRAQLYLQAFGTVKGILTLELTYDLFGNSVVEQEIDLYEVGCVEKRWVSCDFKDAYINCSKPLYLVLRFTGNYSEGFIRWFGCSNDPYEPGYMLTAENADGIWMTQSDMDCCFRTFGISEYDLDISYFTGGTGARIQYGLTNSGRKAVVIDSVDLIIDGGMFLTGYYYQDETDVLLEPGEMIHGYFFPIIGLSFSSKVSLTVKTMQDVKAMVSKHVSFLISYIYVKPIF